MLALHPAWILDVQVRASRYIALWDGDSKALRASLERIADLRGRLVVRCRAGRDFDHASGRICTLLDTRTGGQRFGARSARQASPHTLPALRRMPEFGDSITFVVHKHRRHAQGKPNRFTLNVSAKPSRRLAAADG